MKKVMVQFNFPGMTARQYEQAWDEMRKTGNDHPKGLIHHAGAQQGNNLVISDVWESKEDFNNFGKVLTPILNKIGAPNVQPTISDVLYEQNEQQITNQGPQSVQFGSQGQQAGQRNQAQQPGQYSQQPGARSQNQQPGARSQNQQPSNQAQQPGQPKNQAQQPGQRGRQNEEEI